MSEPLVIEIQKENKILVNAYYEWGGYTISAITYAQKIIQRYRTLAKQPDELLAIRMLEATGAGISLKNREDIHKKYPNENFQQTKGRKEGFINYQSRVGKEINKQVESTVQIDITKKTVNINAFKSLSRDNFKALKNLTEEELKRYPRITIHNQNITKTELDILEKQTRELIERGYFAAIQPNGHIVSTIH